MADLLFLSQRIPYPPTKGDKIRSWHILKHLAARHRVHLGCFIDDRHDLRYESALTEICASVHCEPLHPLLARLRSLAALPRRAPMTLSYFGSRSLQRWVDDTVRRHHIEHAFVFCSAMAPYAAGMSDAVRILDMVDVDSAKWTQYAATSGPLGRWIYAREGARLLAFEREMASGFDRTLLVSPAEAALFRELAPECGERVLAVPNGVDCDYFSPARSYPNPFAAAVRTVVFTGAMDYRPNIEAVTWFADHVMPVLTARDPTLEFWIVGTNPATAVRKLAARSGVRVTGRVEDVRPYLFHAGAVVAPLLTARGIQNKVLEAMAMAKPVVATPQAQEGIEALADEELLVAADAPGFAARVEIALSARATVIGQRARRRVQSDYNWSRSLSAIDAVLDRHFSPGLQAESLAADRAARMSAR